MRKRTLKKNDRKEKQKNEEDSREAAVEEGCLCKKKKKYVEGQKKRLNENGKNTIHSPIKKKDIKRGKMKKRKLFAIIFYKRA